MTGHKSPTSSSTVRWVILLVILVALLIAGGIALTLLLRDESAAAVQKTLQLPPTAAAPTATAIAKTQVRSVPPPRSTRALQVFDYGWFTVGYDNERRAGAWGRYELDGPIIHKESQPSRPTFRTEAKSAARVTTKDYSNPNNLFERGHIVPSYAMWSRFGDDARKATFIMTNVFPQDEDLNGRLWEDIEDDIAGQAKGGVVGDEGYAGRLRNITVIAGPVYETASKHLPSGIPIPEACFHIIYDLDEATGTYRARAYLIPNQAKLSGPVSKYATSIRGIEKVTGLDFLPDGGAEADALENAPSVVDRW